MWSGRDGTSRRLPRPVPGAMLSMLSTALMQCGVLQTIEVEVEGAAPEVSQVQCRAVGAWVLLRSLQRLGVHRQSLGDESASALALQLRLHAKRSISSIHLQLSSSSWQRRHAALKHGEENEAFEPASKAKRRSSFEPRRKRSS